MQIVYICQKFLTVNATFTVASFLTFLFKLNIIKYYALLQEIVERSFYEIEQNCVTHIVCH